jgi:phosphoheptose isomerase
VSPRAHLAALRVALDALEETHLTRIERLGVALAVRLLDGSRLLVAGNGGSAAHAQHLAAELVGRYRAERQALSAIALHAETSTLTAVVNDYGPLEGFARQVRAHGRRGDVFLGISTSGESANVIAAAHAAREAGVACWALTGPLPNALASVSDEAVAVAAGSTATVQELHQIVVHLLCEAVDREVVAAARRLRVVA